MNCTIFVLLRCQDLAHIHEILKNVFLIFPNYCLGRGLMDVAFNEYYNEFCFKMGKTCRATYYLQPLVCRLLTYIKEVIFSSAFVCLFVCLLAGLRKNH